MLSSPLPFALIDTHCHINMMVKKEFDVPLTAQEIGAAQEIITRADAAGVKKIINVGTSLIESRNCVTLATTYPQVFAAIGIHPNDATPAWRTEIAALQNMLATTAPGTIVAIGECGIDMHYPDYDLERQRAAFRAQIELALEHKLPLIIHNRTAGDETLRCLEPYRGEALRGVIHCFSEDLAWAQAAIELGFVLGIGGTITYPKNELLRTVVNNTPLEKIILETDAPFLPVQSMRGKQNAPQYIADIAEYVADLKKLDRATVARTTTTTAQELFILKKS